MALTAAYGKPSSGRKFVHATLGNCIIFRGGQFEPISNPKAERINITIITVIILVTATESNLDANVAVVEATNHLVLLHHTVDGDCRLGK